MYLTAYWGNDDVSATIRISKATWQSILNGGKHSAECKYHYEGSSYTADWFFNKRLVNIYGSDGRDCVLDMPIEELIINP